MNKSKMKRAVVPSLTEFSQIQPRKGRFEQNNVAVVSSPEIGCRTVATKV